MTDDRQTDRHNTVPIARPLVRSAKKRTDGHHSTPNTVLMHNIARVKIY